MKRYRVYIIFFVLGLFSLAHVVQSICNPDIAFEAFGIYNVGIVSVFIGLPFKGEIIFVNIAVNILGGREVESPSYSRYNAAFDRCAEKFQGQSSLLIGNSNQPADFRISCTPESSFLNLMDHMAVKLVLNIVSTGTMVLMGRLTSNWMSWVEVSNKKLRDRGIRLISELCGVGYKEACFALHETLEEMKTLNFTNQEKPSPVQYTIRKFIK